MAVVAGDAVSSMDTAEFLRRADGGVQDQISKERGRRLHQKSQKCKSEIPLENAAENPLDISSESPLDKWQSFGNYHRKVKFCRKMPLKTHDDFWGVNFWRAVFCP